MTPLLEALCDAAKVGFDAPKCRRCDGCGQVQGEYTGYFRLCSLCHATGLDASDPERLIGRAHAWFHDNACDVLHRWPTNEVRAFRDIPIRLIPNGATPPEYVERHDGTPTGLATALLRLVARTDTPKETL